MAVSRHVTCTYIERRKITDETEQSRVQMDQQNSKFFPVFAQLKMKGYKYRNNGIMQYAGT